MSGRAALCQAASFAGSGYRLSYAMGPCAGASRLSLTFGSGSPEDKAAHEASATAAAAGQSDRHGGGSSGLASVTFAQQATFELSSADLAWALDDCEEDEFRDCLGG